MSKLDSRLKFLLRQEGEVLNELESLGRFAIKSLEVPAPRARVLLRFDGDLDRIEQEGFQTCSVAGDVATGFVELETLERIAAIEKVIMIESSRPMRKELDLSVPEIMADIVHSTPPGYKGSGVVVGIIDTGINFTHECFRKQDGTSRILFIWDQNLTPTGSESSPSGFNYGVEYTKQQIDAAIASANPFTAVRHQDPYPGHGTHVAGISAGDGSVAGNQQPAFTYIGVAPEADIIVVSNSVTTEALGDSASTLDAIQYIFNKASLLGRAVVINLSQGDNIGPHDGTSLLERGMDNLLGGQGRAMVKSAGNEGDSNRHASATVLAGGTVALQMVVPAGDTTPDTIDIWYPGTDRFGISITPPATPGGIPTQFIQPGNTTTLNLNNGNQVFIDSVLNDPNNNDNRIYIQLMRGTAPAIQQGTWTLTLSGITVTNGRFDAWIERGLAPQFIGNNVNNARTISIPGTSQKIIAVASYITKGSGVGNISSFSSVGPTRDGRQKPDIAAPGETIMSALNSASGNSQYQLMSGTSMAAPHIVGVIALMLQRKKTLTQEEIKDCLTKNARKDAFTGNTPNNTWGYGKVDAKASSDCVAAISCSKFQMVIPCTYIKQQGIPCMYIRELGLTPCKLITQPFIPRTCKFIIQSGACRYDRMLATCPIESLIPGTTCPGESFVPPSKEPGIRTNILVRIDPKALNLLDPKVYEVVEGEATEETSKLSSKSEKETEKNHFTQLTQTGEEKLAEAFGPEWENLFAKGNDIGY